MKRRQSGQVLIVLFGSLLMGGSGLAAGFLLTGRTSSEIRKHALTIVEDDNRANKIKAVLKQWDREVKGIEKTRNKHIDDLVTALRRHDASPANFDPLFAAFDDLESHAFDTSLDMRFALREQLSPEEWRELFALATSASRNGRETNDPNDNHSIVAKEHQPSSSAPPGQHARRFDSMRSEPGE